MQPYFVGGIYVVWVSLGWGGQFTSPRSGEGDICFSRLIYSMRGTLRLSSSPNALALRPERTQEADSRFHVPSTSETSYAGEEGGRGELDLDMGNMVQLSDEEFHALEALKAVISSQAVPAIDLGFVKRGKRSIGRDSPIENMREAEKVDEVKVSEAESQLKPDGRHKNGKGFLATHSRLNDPLSSAHIYELEVSGRWWGRGKTRESECSDPDIIDPTSRSPQIEDLLLGQKNFVEDLVETALRREIDENDKGQEEAAGCMRIDNREEALIELYKSDKITHKVNLQIAGQRPIPPLSKNLAEWPRRFLDLLANDLLYSSIRAKHGVRRKSTLLRAMKKVNFITKLQKAVDQSKKSAFEIEIEKQKLRREMREKKALSGVSSQGMTGKAKYGKKLDLGVIEDTLSNDPVRPITCSLVSNDFLNSTNFLYHHSFQVQAQDEDYADEVEEVEGASL